MIIFIFPLVISFAITILFAPIWIDKAKQIGLVWEDMNKKNFPKNVAGSGGITVLFGFVIGALDYVAINTFIFKSAQNLIEIFTLLSVILITSFIGFIDDLLGWRKGGLNKKSRIILLILASIPLVVINAGESRMMGIEFGLLYPLFFVPLGVLGASVAYNFIAGYNGLETSQGIIILTALSIVTWLTGNAWLSLISLIMVACLIGFYFYNKFPAKVFPGDTLTYLIGAMIASIAILGNVEKISIFFFVPYIIETGLKIRGKLKRQSFSKVNEDGSLDVPYGKFYGLEHIAIYIAKKIKSDGKATEKDVVFIINTFQIIIVLIGFLLFGGELIA